MRYRFYVHKQAASWHLVTAESSDPPEGCDMGEWSLTRTGEAGDTSPDVRGEVDGRGFALFKLGGEFADVAADAASASRAANGGESTSQSGVTLERYPVHLGLGATALQEPEFTGSAEWYEAYVSRHAAEGAEGRLVSMFTFRAPWDAWEMHPRGSELVVCTAGELTLIQELEGEHVRTHLRAGEYAINLPGVWHTADAKAPVTALFVTAGLGTQHRARK